MNKRELLEQINELPDDIVFLVSSDEEGNSFRLANFGGVEYGQPDGREWEVYGDEDNAKEWLSEDLEDDEEPDLSTLTKVAVFW